MLRKLDRRRRVDDGERNVNAPDACSGLFSSLLLCGSLAITALLVGLADVKAQEAEPRSYSNTPVGLNFLIAGYVYAQGKMAFDPNLSIADAKFHSNTGVLAYVRSFDFAGQSAKFDVIVPGSSFDAQGLVNGLPREREMTGLGDPRFRFSFNLFGAPALSAKDFANYQQDLIVGVSFQVSAPLGQYDNSKLLNLGNNRWSFKPELASPRLGGPGHSRSRPASPSSATTPISSAATGLRRRRSMRFRHISFTHFSRGSGWPWTASILPAAIPP